MKIRKIGDALPTPNQRIAIGIQAIGEIGRRIWKSGFSVAKAPRTQPIQRPSGTATSTASPKPAPTRNSDAPMCSHERAVRGQLDGAGHDLPRRREDHAARCSRRAPTRPRSAARSRPAAERPGQLACSRSSTPPCGVPGRRRRPHAVLASLRRASAALPAARRGGSTTTRHLAARMRACRRTVARGDLERQAEALAGHHQRRPEDLRHVVRVPQQEHVLDAEREADRVAAGSRPCRRPCAAPRCPSGSRTARRGKPSGPARAPPTQAAEQRHAAPRAIDGACRARRACVTTVACD